MSVRNNFIVTGNIGKVNVIAGKEGKEPFTAISIALDDSYKPKEAAEWVERTSWVEATVPGDRSNSLSVGSIVIARGKAVADAYLDKEGKAVGTLKIANAQISVLSRKDKGEGAHKAEPATVHEPVVYQSTENESGEDGDDLPF